MNKQQALHKFWNSFTWSARDENTVPDDAMTRYDGHYITYAVADAALDEPIPIYGNLWAKDSSWETITKKANEISEALTVGGMRIPFDDGYIWICRGVPFAQRMPDDDDTIRRIYINLMAEYLSAN